MPNSYDPAEFLNAAASIKNDTFVLTSAGNFYGPRTPEPFLKALSILSKEEDLSGLKVKFIGSLGKFKDLIYKYNIGNIVEALGTLPRNDTIKYLFKSDALILIDSPSKNESVFLPSKLLDYINIKKPILAITPRGPSAEVVIATRTGVVRAPEDIIGIKNIIKEYYHAYKRSELKIEPDLNEIEKYSAKNYTKTLVNIIEKLI